LQKKPRGDLPAIELPRKVDFFTAIMIVGHCDTAVCLRDLLNPKMSFNYRTCASKKQKQNENRNQNQKAINILQQEMSHFQNAIL